MSVLLVMTVPVVFLIGVALWGERVRRRFTEQLSSEPRLTPLDRGFLLPIGCVTRDEPKTSCAAGGGRRSARASWEVSAEVPRLGARTSLSLSLEGRVGQLREKLGMSDVHK